jgi:acetate CoA/acetoacetate CoA-transferase beta subunit
LANWIVPGKKVPGMGGAMELAQKARKVIVLMNHCDKAGKPKILTSCTLPLTSKACVDLVITELAVFRVTPEGLLLTELFPPYDLQEVVNKTECEFTISEVVRKISY